MEKSDRTYDFLHGCDYNPEQWMEYPKILEEDMKYMKEAHCNVVSLGIFSWALLEPQEGVYDFAFMDEMVDRLTENDIKIILATPSAARPRWMAEKYPEVLRVGKDRRRILYSERHNHCYTSPIYREKVAAINRRIAERYKDNKNIIMWHISNELGGECFCDLCQQAFRDWLKEKYHNDLAELNHAWWSGFWSHNVTDWQQIYAPTYGGEGDHVMTGLYADWRQFVSVQSTDFLRHEIEVVKSVAPHIPATTNFTGPYNRTIDYHYMKDFVDIVAWDSYPEWHSARGNELEAYSIAFAHDMNRCFKNKPFLLMESTPSLLNWMEICKLKKPGMHKLSSLQAVAHGSDSVQYFQWRKGRGGSEKFHGAVMDHNGRTDTRVFREVKELGITLEKIREIAGSSTVSKVAVVYEYKNRWLLDNASGFQNEDKKYKRTCINHYKEFWKRGINVDVISINSDLSVYDVVILPMLYSMSEEEIDKVEQYVKNGGTAVATYITGYVNETDLCYLGGFPGSKLKDVFGLTADEIDSFYAPDYNYVKIWDKEYKAVDYCELITARGAQVEGTYTEDFYQGTPAVLKNQYGKGTAYYIGFRDTGDFLSDFYECLIEEKQLGGCQLPAGVTVQTRQNQEGCYTFVQNYGDEAVDVSLGGIYEDMESGETVDGLVSVDRFGIRVLKSKL